MSPHGLLALLAAAGKSPALLQLGYVLQPGGLRIVDWQPQHTNCSTPSPANVSHCSLPPVPSPTSTGAALVRVIAAADPPPRWPCVDMSSAPPPLRPYLPDVNRVLAHLSGRNIPLPESTHSIPSPNSTLAAAAAVEADQADLGGCWRLGEYKHRQGDPLVASLEMSSGVLLVSSELLALLPKDLRGVPLPPVDRLTRWYAQLLELLPAAGAADAERVAAGGRQFWEFLMEEEAASLPQFGAQGLLGANPKYNPLQCVSCIVLLAFGSLAVANFGGIAIGCYICGCYHLGSAACTELLQSVLYLVIALLPVIALLIFEACKAFCVNSAALSGSLLLLNSLLVSHASDVSASKWGHRFG